MTSALDLPEICDSALTWAVWSCGLAASAARVAGATLLAVASWVRYFTASSCATGPFSTRVVTVVTTSGTMKTDTAMTSRMTRPQTARPVAVSAGLCRSTVSVKLAIQGA